MTASLGTPPEWILTRLGPSPPKRQSANMKALIAFLLATAPLTAAAADIEFKQLAPGIFAFVGDVGPRSALNEGLNANLGLVVTGKGVLLIDSGAGELNARRIHEAVRRITSEPVRWVINTGGQDHRWLGNGYFARLGAQLIAHRDAVADMRSRGGDQLVALRSLLGLKMEGTEAMLPNRLIAAPDAEMELGGLRIELRHRGGGHTPGDMMVWLPAARVLFSGDIVYVDRLLAVLPVSSTRQWLQAFEAVEELSPTVIIPGHGRLTDLATARRETKAYLQELRAHMRKAVDDGQDISAAIRSFDLGPFQHLANAAELHPGNASRVYLELERE